MDCSTVAGLLDERIDERLSASCAAALDMHLSGCDECADAYAALCALRSERSRAVPAPRPGLLAQAVRTARRSAPARPPRSSFWLGTAVGGAVAAGIAAAVMIAGPLGAPAPPATSAAGELTLTMNETREVNIAIDSPEAVADARIRVVLSGAAALAGRQGETEVSWSTPLDRGVNLLTLPVALEGRGGGHVLVEVRYGSRSKTFAVYVDEAAEGAKTVEAAEGRV